MATNELNGSNGNGTHAVYSTPDIYTTSKGKKIKLIGLNPARLEKIQSAGKVPPVPTRKIENDLGVAQVEELTADTLVDDDERARWREYMIERNAVEQKRSENVLKYVFNDGVMLVDAPEDNVLQEWKQEQEEVWGLEVPGNRIDLKVDYLNAEVIGNSEDLAEVMAGVMERTGVPSEALDEVRATFRGGVRGSAAGETATE